ncbi:hypothetical protein D7Z54_24635 [Salibacterium salarium]|uniref:Uncharacterized protein n=1 Tax=Salibacterium salarium TaxID=284579 RepID=A0A3R9Q016_9BACI|nr:hypothetical protein [Salibacterium salarium]RSL30687.1 hypothetical protein D7Z54_24635 [Salibacterium salarium]
MTTICPACFCFHQMNGVMKSLFIIFMVIIFGALSYMLVPRIMPGDSGFVFLWFSPYLIGGLLFGLALFGFAIGTTNLCEKLRR